LQRESLENPLSPTSTCFSDAASSFKGAKRTFSILLGISAGKKLMRQQQNRFDARRKKRAIKQLCAEKFFSSRGKVQLQSVQRKRWNGKLSFQEKSIATAALSNGGKLKLRFHSTKFLFATKSAVNFLGI
jgi:hypothetical protein